MESEDPNTVFWIERRGGRSGREKQAFSPDKAAAEGSQESRLSSGGNRRMPLGVASTYSFRPRRSTSVPILRECLWAKLDCAVLTSATLAVGGGFDYIRQRLGFEHARESVAALALRLSTARPCSTSRPTCPTRALRNSQRKRPSAFASCSKSHADAPSSSSPAMRR